MIGITVYIDPELLKEIDDDAWAKAIIYLEQCGDKKYRYYAQSPNKVKVLGAKNHIPKQADGNGCSGDYGE